MRVSLLIVVLAAACAPRPQSPASPPSAGAPVAATESLDPETQVVLLERSNAVLSAALKADDEKLANEALRALGYSRRADALGVLKEAVAAESGKRRFSAARGLRALGDPAARAIIVEAWGYEGGWAVKKELAIAAGATGAVELIPQLEVALDDPHPKLHEAVAWALDALGNPKGTAALAAIGNPDVSWVPKEGTDGWARKVLNDDREGDKQLAARILAEIGTPDDVTLVEPYLDGLDPMVGVYAAAVVLRHLQ